MALPSKSKKSPKLERRADRLLEDMALRFRPHHFLCTLGFQGKGYSPEFIRNFQSIADRLRSPAGDQTLIEVVDSTDTICSPCPNRNGTECSAEEKIRLLDQNHQELLDLKPGQKISWGEAKELMAQRVDAGSFRQACESCAWRPLGVCERALLELKKNLRDRGVGLGLATLLLFFLMAEPSAWAKARHARLAKAERRPSQVEKVVKKTKETLPRDLRALKSPAQWSSIPSSSLYFDHAQALLARRAQLAAEKALSKRLWASAQSHARESQRHWLAIQEHCSSSPWIKRISEELGKADLVVAQALHARKQFSRAREAFEKAWDRVSFSMVTAQQVSSYFESCQKNSSEFWVPSAGNVCAAWARRLISAFVKQSPERSELSQKWQKVVDYVTENSSSGAAPRVQQSYRQSDEDVLAWEEVVPLLRERKLRQVQRPLREFLEKYPRSALRQKARYWLGVSQIEDGEVPEDVRPLFETVAKESPLSFYGLLASRQLGKSPEDFLSSGALEPKSFEPKLHPTEMLAIEKAQALLNAGEPSFVELAQMDLREVRPKENFDSDFLVYLAELNGRAGSYLGAFGVVTELIQRGAKAAASEWAPKIVFPVERWPLIQENSAAQNIDPVWVLSLMKQESAFDGGALSSSGAVGLMQLMPATAVSTDPAIRRVDLVRDVHNIRIGTAYMGEMFRRFRGNIALATAAYNAGPNAVERWMKEYGLKDTENGLSLGLVEFIESIPYKETRDYVGSIIRNYYWYSRRLPQPFSVPQPLQYFWVRNVPSAVGKSADAGTK
ncbi:DUF1284 domain-containing protein [bacterium]|nr:DUF1284 domain-containing protein [bacterium]